MLYRYDPLRNRNTTNKVTGSALRIFFQYLSEPLGTPSDPSGAVLDPLCCTMVDATDPVTWLGKFLLFRKEPTIKPNVMRRVMQGLTYAIPENPLSCRLVCATIVLLRSPSLVFLENSSSVFKNSSNVLKVFRRHCPASGSTAAFARLAQEATGSVGRK